eukprot:423962_1
MSYKENLVVHGYINQIYPHFAPMVIKKLILTFYDEAFCWYFNSKALRNLLSMSNGQCIISNEIRYNKDISFWLILYPNGRKSMDGFIQCYLYTKPFCPKIKHCTVSFQLLCVETNTAYKSQCKFVRNGRNSFGMNYNLRRRQCLALKRLTIRCVIHLVEIKYDAMDKHSDDLRIYYPSVPLITLHKSLRFEWIISGALLANFKNCACGSRFYSQEFEYWFIDCAPHGDVPSHRHQFQLSLKLWKWPTKLGCMDAIIQCITRKDNEIVCREYRRQLRNDEDTYKTSISLYKNYFMSDMFTFTHFLSFTVTIHILHIYDWNGAEIWPFQALYKDILCC